MPEGITILSTQICNGSFTVGFTIFIGLFIGVCLLFAAIVIYGLLDCLLYIKSEWETIYSVIALVLIVILPIAFSTQIYNNHQYKDYTKYKVTIDDHVGFNELASRYNIIGHDGSIYTIVEKDSEYVSK